MAEQIPLVIIGGLVQQLPSGDTLPTSIVPPAPATGVQDVDMKNVELDTLIAGSPVYVGGPGEIARSIADSASTASVIGLTTANINVFATGSVQVIGVITLTTAQWDAVASTTGGLTANALYYLSPFVPPPMLTETEPSGIGQFITVVGRGLSPTQMSLIIERPVAV